MDTEVFAFTLLVMSLSLLAGKFLRLNIPLLRKLFLPSSVIGGLVLLLAGPQALGLPVLRDLPAVWETMGILPAYLINIIFAAFFIGKSIPPLKTVWKLAGPQVCFAQVLTWGQYLVGILAGLFVLTPLLGLPEFAGALIEIGFTGGHGTAAGLAPTFEALGWPEGQDVGLGMATLGILVGVITGIIMINWASRHKIIEADEASIEKAQKEDTHCEFEDREGEEPTRPMVPQSIEPLSLHLALLGGAIGIGYLFLEGLIYLERVLLLPLGWEGIMDYLPLFPLAMLGGIVIQYIFKHLFKNHLVIDRKQINRLQGLSLDILIVAALGSLDLQVLGQYWEAILLLALIGTLWNLLAFALLAPRMIKNYWFQRGIGDYGQSMGMVAMGLLLIRVADPQNRSDALTAFGYKQLLFEPVVGGGLFTSASMPLIAQLGAGTILWVVGLVMIFWLILGFNLRRKL